MLFLNGAVGGDLSCAACLQRYRCLGRNPPQEVRSSPHYKQCVTKEGNEGTENQRVSKLKPKVLEYGWGGRVRNKYPINYWWSLLKKL